MVPAQTHTGKGPRFFVSTDVRFGSKADMPRCPNQVRFYLRKRTLLCSCVSQKFCEGGLPALRQMRGVQV